MVGIYLVVDLGVVTAGIYLVDETGGRDGRYGSGVEEVIEKGLYVGNVSGLVFRGGDVVNVKEIFDFG